MLNGVLPVHKEAGYTSMDVVAKLRGIVKQKKIGHTGTLDPMATGVLPICFGYATRLSERLMEHTKEYEAIMRFGVVTDTQDTTGIVLHRTEGFSIEKEAFLAAAEKYIGGYEQLPPMFSARKVNGKRLYELARKGEEVERRTKFAEISEITLLSLEEAEPFSQIAKIRVVCGKGTYIRTLIHDIGQDLGCGAAMEALVRTRVGEYTLAESRTLSEVSALFAEGKLEKALTPMETLFQRFPSPKLERAYRMNM